MRPPKPRQSVPAGASANSARPIAAPSLRAVLNSPEASPLVGIRHAGGASDEEADQEKRRHPGDETNPGVSPDLTRLWSKPVCPSPTVRPVPGALWAWQRLEVTPILRKRSSCAFRTRAVDYAARPIDGGMPEDGQR